MSSDWGAQERMTPNISHSRSQAGKWPKQAIAALGTIWEHHGQRYQPTSSQPTSQASLSHLQASS